MGCNEVISKGSCITEYISTIPPLLILLLVLPNAIFTLHKIRIHKKELVKEEHIKRDNKKNTNNRIIIFGHTFRWLIFFGAFVVHIFHLSASVMSAVKFQYLSKTNTAFILIYVVNDFFKISALIVVLIVYTYIIEFNRRVKYLWSLWTYWILTLLCDIARLVVLDDYGNSATYIFTVILVLLYGCLMILDTLLLFRQKLKCTRLTHKIIEEIDDIKYTYQSVTFPSKVTTHWMNTILLEGHSKPLEIENLGKLPNEESSEYHFHKFKKVFEEEKLRATKEAKLPSLWKCYLKAYWPGLLIALSCHLISVNVVYLGPIFLDTIVEYVIMVVEAKESSGNETSRIPLFGPLNVDGNSTALKQDYFVSTTELFSNGYVLSLAICIGALVQGLANQNFIFKASQMGIRLKTAIQTMVFDKTLRLSSQMTSADGKMSQGQILNHMSVDPMHLFMFFNMGLMAIGIPVQVVVGCILLYIQLGVTTLISAAIILLCVPIQYLLGKKMASLQKKVLECSDERIKKSNETLQSMKLLKLYSWEDTFCSSILRTRKKEVMYLLKAGLCRVLSLCVTDGNPIAACVVCFTLYPYIEGKPLSPGKVFAAYSVIMVLSVCLFLTPMVINIIAHAVVSTRRLQKFLVSPELQEQSIQAKLDDSVDSTNGSRNIEMVEIKKNGNYKAVTQKDANKFPEMQPLQRHLTPSEINSRTSRENLLMTPQLEGGNVLEVTDAEFSWGNISDNNESPPILTDINLQVRQGCVVMVVGSVGSGKSSLLYGLMGEMIIHKGMVNWRSDVSLAYGSQKAWLLNATLRENILFGLKYNEKLYNKVIKACALLPDIDMLMAGDLTEIGEKGINLSGGQKQRVSLARCMYSHANVILLDDPFSALDAHVGSHIFEHGVQKLLLKQRRTVVLVTHQLQYLPHADKILVMDKGKITLEGTYEGLLKTNPEIFKIIESEDEKNIQGTDEEAVLSYLSPTTTRSSSCSPPTQSSLASSSAPHHSFLQAKSTENLKQISPSEKHSLLFANTISKSHEQLSGAVLKRSKSGGEESRSVNKRAPRQIVEDVQYHMGAIRSASSISSLTHIDIAAKNTDLRKQYLKGQLSKEAVEAEKGRLIEEEERETGSVSWRIYMRYAKAATWILVAIMLTGYIGKLLVLRLITDLWLARWTQASTEAANLLSTTNNTNITVNQAYDLNYYVTGYTLLSLFGIFVLFFQVLSLELMALNGSRNLHRCMVKAITKAPMRFFDITPIGRIINRMSGDTNTLDEKMQGAIDGSLFCFLFIFRGLLINIIFSPVFILPAALLLVFYLLVQRFYIPCANWKMAVTIDGLLYCSLYVLGGLILNTIFTPVFIVPAVIMLVFYLLVQRFYIASSRELQRLESISKSPILAHFSETLGGLTTLRAYGHKKRFQRQNWKHVDVNSTALLFLHAANVWMGIRLDCIGSIIILSAAVCMVTSGILGLIDPSIVSIGIAYSLSAGVFINWFMRCMSELEMWMNASERISYYTDVQPEQDVETSDIPDAWPSKGEIRFEKICLRYDSSLATVVKDLDLYIQAGHKTGICGRTGSGKSSLSLSIFNMIDICQGRILIDGVDIKKVRLHDLRSRLAIIPQDPVLFSGTVRVSQIKHTPPPKWCILAVVSRRYNLDPESRHTEPEIWRALEIAQLIPLIGSLQGRLDAKVTEGGDNFSVGQRQLFCLARAFLRNATILVMDEPTASVDMTTDAIIQEVTHSMFKDKTILTIAHRVATILNYDTIVVMDKGRIVESGAPNELIEKNGIFAQMLKKNL